MSMVTPPRSMPIDIPGGLRGGAGSSGHMPDSVESAASSETLPTSPTSPSSPSKSPGGSGGSFRKRALSFRRRKTAPPQFNWVELPEAVQFLVVEFLDIPTLYSIAQLSRAGRDFALHDVLWRPLYMRQFCAGERDVKGIAGFSSAFASRLRMPEPGDKVQVLWEGSFNLVSAEGVTGYEGRAWWEARIVERDGDEYKIHYPQWDSAIWDEWVPRDRIRWPPDPDDGGVPLRKGDLVEMRCLSSSGRSPWLESCIARVDDGRCFVGSSVVTGHKQVPRENLRMVRRGRPSHHNLHISMPKCSIM